MKRILSFFALICCGFALLNAQVTSNPSPIYRGYTGAITLTYDPAEGDGGMVQAIECYSHIGLLTSKSESDKDWKYLKNPNWGTTEQPKWTRVGSKWQLKIDNFYEWFGCPTTEVVNAFVMVFHNGKGSSSLQGKAEGGKDIILKLEDQPTCFYTLEMFDSANDGWEGNVLRVTEGTHVFEYTLESGGNAVVQIPSFGGNPVFTWHENGGGWLVEKAFTVYNANKSIMFMHDFGDAFPDPLFTATASPCNADVPNDKAITGLSAIVTGNKVDITWDDKSSAGVDNYYIEIFDPKGNQVTFDGTTTNSYSYTGLDAVDLSGIFKVTVTPRNSSYEVMALFSEYEFEYTEPAIGSVDIHVLIPSDSKFDPSKGVTAFWVDNDMKEQEGIVLTQEGTSRWWKGTINVNKKKYLLTVKSAEIAGIVHLAQYTAAYLTNADEVYFEVRGNLTKDSYNMAKVDATAPDHNWQPLTAVATPGKGTVDLDVTTADGKAPQHEIYLYTGDKKYFGSYFTTSPLPYTLNLSNDTDIHITSWTIQAYQDYNSIGDQIEGGAFTILEKDNLPTGVEIIVAPSGTTLKWDVYPNVDTYKYHIFVKDATGSTIVSKDLLASSLTEVDGKVSYTFVEPLANGPAMFSIYVMNNVPEVISNVRIVNFDVALPLNDKTIDIYIASENNMERAGNPYIWYWSSTVPEGKCVATADMGGNKYQAVITDDDEAASYGFLVVNKQITSDADWATAQKSKDVNNIMKKDVCYQLNYKPDTATTWTLSNLPSCSFTDEYYKITSVDVVWNTDHLMLNSMITTVNTTPQHYFFYYRRHDSSDPWIFLDDAPYYWYGDFPVIPAPTTAEYDLKVVPTNKVGYEYIQVGAAWIDKFSIPASTYALTNMTATITNDVNVTFTWDKNTSVHHYGVAVYDKATNEEMVTGTGLYDNSYTAYIQEKGEYYWSVRTYDASDNLISESLAPGTFTITEEPDFTLTNVQFKFVDKMTALLSFDSHPAAHHCHLILQTKGGSYQAWDSEINGIDGHWSLLYSFSEEEKGSYEWMIMVESVDGSYLLDGWKYLANFVIPQPVIQYTLDISAGAGGSVNTAVNGLHDEGETVHIVATPDAGFVFQKWSDENTDKERDIVMNADKTLVASFVAASTEYTLTISAGAGGSVNTDVNKSYTVGTSVHIVATPAEGYVFDQWSDGDKNAERDIIMNADKTLSATFKVKGVQYTLNISAGEHGSVNTAVNGNYDAGEHVTLTATPDAGYAFNQWSDGDKNASRTITMDKDYTLTALFYENKTYTVKVTAGSNGKVNGKTSINTTLHGLEVLQLEAQPEEGYTLDEWSDDKSNKSLTREIVITRDTTIKATFRELERYRLTVEIRPSKAGTVKLNGEVREENTLKVVEGKSIEVVATAAEGYSFKRWEYNEESIGTASTISILMNKNKTVTAVFQEAVEAIDNVSAQTEGAELFFYQGSIYIRRDGKIYNAQGKRIQ